MIRQGGMSPEYDNFVKCSEGVQIQLLQLFISRRNCRYVCPISIVFILPQKHLELACGHVIGDVQNVDLRDDEVRFYNIVGVLYIAHSIPSGSCNFTWLNVPTDKLVTSQPFHSRITTGVQDWWCDRHISSEVATLIFAESWRHHSCLDAEDPSSVRLALLFLSNPWTQTLAKKHTRFFF